MIGSHSKTLFDPRSMHLLAISMWSLLFSYVAIELKTCFSEDADAIDATIRSTDDEHQKPDIGLSDGTGIQDELGVPEVQALSSRELLLRNLRLEKSFLLRVTALDDEQVRKLNALTPRKVYGASLDSTDEKTQEDALEIRKRELALQRSLSSILDPNQEKTYRKELRHRTESRRAAKALQLAFLIDRELGLTVKQLNEVNAKLRTWSGVLLINLDAYETTDHMLPPIPVELLAPYLTAQQFAYYQKSIEQVVFLEDDSDDDFMALFPVMIER